MSSIEQLHISRLRNITGMTLEPGRNVNLICGDNGSGKTSILEAIHLLATGKSFRSNRTMPVVQMGEKDYVIFLELAGGTRVGMQRGSDDRPLLKVQGERQSGWVEVARLLPVQVIDSTSFRLLEGGPKDRRRFLDWGVFHVEPGFVEHWRNCRKCIANRNALLRTPRLDRRQLNAWNAELCREAELVDRARSEYFAAFLPVFDSVLKEIGDFEEVSLTYRRGWDKDKSLEQVLGEAESSDTRNGMTQSGPHRADIVVKKGAMPAAEVLSRGQQKILVTAMKLAQGRFQNTNSAHRCIFLVDDLPAELDEKNRARVCRFLESLECQVFLTSVDESAIESVLDPRRQHTKFHVEHGKIAA